MFSLRMLIVILSFFAQVSSLSAEENISIGYLELVVPRPPVLSNLEEIPEDEGLAGVVVGVKDNQTTGKFLNHNYALETRVTGDANKITDAAKELLADNPYLIVNAPSDVVYDIANLSEAQGAIIFNVAATDITLRSESCRANLFHTIPSRNMRADALAQFGLKKRWTKWAVIHGVHNTDKAFLYALKVSAKKFDIKLVATKEWAFDADMRRNAAQEVPLFTQDMPDHDLMVIADELGDFGRYIMYNTWIPRPVAGSEGIVPTAWSGSVEQHGAAQLQSRFKKNAGRDMRPIDYAAWAAIRSIGESVTRTNSSDANSVRSYILSDEFQLAGFKGRPLTYRKWNGQLRQPIPLSHSRAVVASAPLEGFLHQRNELDTLGLDKTESACTAFTE